jgi:hypothetical protein
MDWIVRFHLCLIYSLSLIFLISNCKARRQSGDLMTVSGSSFAENDPSLYILDERKYDGSNTDTLLVRRLDCGGEERYLKGTIEDLTKTCYEVSAISLTELLQLHYLPYFSDISGINKPTPPQQEFLIYMLRSLRAFPTRNDPLSLSVPMIRAESFDLSKDDVVYAESFAGYLAKLAAFLPYRSSNTKSATQITTPQAFQVSGLPGGWNEQIFSVASGVLKSTTVVTLSAKTNAVCAVTLSSIRFGDRFDSWTTIPFKATNIDGDGYYRQFRLTPPKVSSDWTYVRFLWRAVADSPSNCSVKLNGSALGPAEDEAPIQPSTPQQPPTVIRSRTEKFRQLALEFGNVGHRLHHLLWHALRNGWNRPGVTQNDRQQMMQVVPQQNWTPPRPVLYGSNGVVDVRRTEQEHPGAGEDFFHMHREMTRMAKNILGDDLVAVPSVAVLLQQRDRMIAEGLAQRIPVPSVQQFQTRIAALRQYEQTLNAINLKTISLSALGTQLEWTLHNGIHETFARPAAELLLVGGNNPWSSKTFFATTMPWNQPTYQHLGDPYASASNPLFWIIHAYVDQWVDRWALANNHDEVSDNCTGRTRCYQWLQSIGGKVWDGGMSVDHAHELRVSAISPDLVRNLVNMGTFVTR